MKVSAKAGELIADLLYKHTGQDNDQLEQAFYQLNPHVRREVFLSIPKWCYLKSSRYLKRNVLLNHGIKECFI